MTGAPSSAAIASATASLPSASSSAIPKFRYLSAWFCPYAHRATLALEHHRGRIEYEWVEALGWYLKQSEDPSTGSNDTGTTQEQEWYYHWKAPELKRVNPSALVPTLIPMLPVLRNNMNDSTEVTATCSRPELENLNNADDDEEEEEVDPSKSKLKRNKDYFYDESRAVYESLVVMDYVDALSMRGSNNNIEDRLVPVEDAYEAARCRIWTDKVNRDCCSPYYGVLVRKEATERREHFHKLLRGLEEFSKELQKTSGALFLANNQLSVVDLALFPWAYRYYVLEHYRGPNFCIPQHSDALQPYHRWYEEMMKRECVQRTLPDKDRYLDHIRKYADGSARSKVANAVRRGVAAHELDDAQDEY